jgi:hypothetical protein
LPFPCSPLVSYTTSNTTTTTTTDPPNLPAVNKQLNDKERVHAALENTHLLGVVEGCLSSADKRGVGGVGEEV